MKHGWEYKKLGDVCNILNGFAFKSEKYVSSGTRVIRITNVQKGHIVDNDPKYYSDEQMLSLQQYALRENDLLMSLTGNVGRVGLLQNELLPAALNQRVACIRVKNPVVDREYLFHILNSDLFEQTAIFNASGIAQKNMSTEWLKQYMIPIPPLDEQQQIVSELDKLSLVIEKKKQQVKELDNLAQAIFYDMFGDPVENEKGWEVKKMGEVVDFINGFAFKSELFKSEGLPIVRISNIQNDIIQENDMVFFSPDDYNEDFKKYEVVNGDIVVAMSGATTGKLGIHKGTKIIYLNQRVGRFLIKYPNKLLNYFLFYYLKSISSLILNDAMGVAQPNISSKQIKDYLIPLPSMSLQQSFAQKIESIERQKELINQSIREAQTLFDSRMEYYFGE